MNTVQLIGNLTRDPELRFTNGGTAVCTIPLAVNRRKRSGDDQERVYVDVVTWGAQAENVAQHLTKGRRVSVAGRSSSGAGPTPKPAATPSTRWWPAKSSSSTRPARGPHRPSRPTPPVRSPSSSRPRGGRHIAARPTDLPNDTL